MHYHFMKWTLFALFFHAGFLCSYEANPEFCEEYGSCCDVNGYVPNTAVCQLLVG